MAQDTLNRSNEAQLAICLSSVEARSGDPLAALGQIGLAIGILHDSGNTVTLRSPLAVLAATLDRLGHYDSAATIAGFAVNPFTSAAVPQLTTSIVHLREVLGDAAYDALARAGEAMADAEVVAYAYDQIEGARAESAAITFGVR
jgi:hypothetical protein